MKKIYIIAVAAMTMFFGCAKFFDVNPKGEVFDNDMFSTAEGCEDALYGIYAELGSTDYLYGGYMLWLQEVLSCNFNPVSSAGMMSLQRADWSAYGAPQIRNGVWDAAYEVISHINNIIDHLSNGPSFPHSDLYLGEALGLRAMLHFDLLRLYGAPVWADASRKAKAIPYVNSYGFSITPFSSLDEAYDLAIADLKRAEQLLARDKDLMPTQRDNSSSGGFASCRIIHFNLYAAQALLARIYWSRNDLENAAVYASKVIEAKKFTFRKPAAFAQPDNGTLDLSETIFGLYSRVSNENNANAYYHHKGGNSMSVSPSMTGLYENDPMSSNVDLRPDAWFESGSYVNLANKVFRDENDKYSGQSILGVSLFRISEMYLIMAESFLDDDPVNAAKWYSDAVDSRGLAAVSSVDMETLTAERRREFYGEGLRYIDMKRQGLDIVVDGVLTLSGKDAANYQIPYPLNEDENRNR